VTDRPTCKRDGCCAKVRARGLCNNHYTQWRNKLGRKLGIANSEDVIRAAMPATMKDIAERTGLKYETVRKAVAKMRREGRAHVEDYRPPTDESGSRYTMIIADGPGEDVKRSKKQVREEALAVRRAWYAANKSRPRRGDPLVLALFGRAAA
jgi:hypothetical protein